VQGKPPEGTGDDGVAQGHAAFRFPPAEFRHAHPDDSPVLFVAPAFHQPAALHPVQQRGHRRGCGFEKRQEVRRLHRLAFPQDLQHMELPACQPGRQGLVQLRVPFLRQLHPAFHEFRRGLHGIPPVSPKTACTFIIRGGDVEFEFCSVKIL